jgi:RNA polymerase sigma-70 factor (sigma-E family)
MDVAGRLDVVGREEVGPVAELSVWTQAGRAAAVSQLFLAHHRRLVGLASVFVDDRETAEEVVQEAFLTLYRRWRLLRDPSAAVAYLNQCVVNGGRQRLRRGRSLSAVVQRLETPAEVVSSAEQSAVVHQDSDRMWQAICSLPRRQREVIVLRYYLDQSEAEIAATLGISPGSVKTHASRGLVALSRRQDLEP